MTSSLSSSLEAKNDHPMRPLPSLVNRLRGSYANPCVDVPGLVAAAYAAGADAELEACFRRQQLLYGNRAAAELRADRRPKPPTKKELALEAIQRIDENAVFNMKSYEIYDELKRDIHFLCSVVNSIQDDEKSND
jgi:hypothetical protein